MKSIRTLYTIGPSLSNERVVEELIRISECGFVATLNSEENIEILTRTQRYIRENSLNAYCCVNIVGFELRVQDIVQDKLDVFVDDIVNIRESLIGNGENELTVNLEHFYEKLAIGNDIYLNCGTVHLSVIDLSKEKISCVVKVGGTIYKNCTVHVAEINKCFDIITQKDLEHIKLCCTLEVDFVNVSFVRGKEDVLAIRRVLDENGGNKIGIISKIENREGVENIVDILNFSDGIIIARGDLGVEIAFVELPVIQNELILASNRANKPVYIATHILSSMKENHIPLRNEIDSVYHLVKTGVSGFLLSSETATGVDPVHVAKVLNKVICYAQF